MNMVIYRQTKILLRESRTVEAATDNSVVTNNQTSTVVTSMAVHVGRNKLGQLEIEATWTLIMGVTSLCVMPCLNIVLIGAFFLLSTRFWTTGMLQLKRNAVAVCQRHVLDSRYLRSHNFPCEKQRAKSGMGM